MSKKMQPFGIGNEARRRERVRTYLRDGETEKVALYRYLRSVHTLAGRVLGEAATTSPGTHRDWLNVEDMLEDLCEDLNRAMDLSSVCRDHADADEVAGQ